MKLLIVGVCCIAVGILNIATGSANYNLVIGGVCVGIGVMDIGIGLVKIMYGE